MRVDAGVPSPSPSPHPWTPATHGSPPNKVTGRPYQSFQPTAYGSLHAFGALAPSTPLLPPTVPNGQINGQGQALVPSPLSLYGQFFAPTTSPAGPSSATLPASSVSPFPVPAPQTEPRAWRFCSRSPVSPGPLNATLTSLDSKGHLPFSHPQVDIGLHESASSGAVLPSGDTRAPKEEIDPFYAPALALAQPAKKGKADGKSPGKSGPRGRSEQPTFLTKLYGILSTPEYDNIIYWDDAGVALVLADPPALCQLVLPIHYKQTKFASFSRQLNIYGFMRKTSLRHTSQGVVDRDASTWSHETLRRDSTLDEILAVKRRVQARPDCPPPVALGELRRRPALNRRRSSSPASLPPPPPPPAAPQIDPRLLAASFDDISSDESDTDSEDEDFADPWVSLSMPGFEHPHRRPFGGRSLPVQGLTLSGPGGIASMSEHAGSAMAGGGVATRPSTSHFPSVPMPSPAPLTAPLNSGFPWHQPPTLSHANGSISPALIRPGTYRPLTVPSTTFPLPSPDEGTSVWHTPMDMPWSALANHTSAFTTSALTAPIHRIGHGLYEDMFDPLNVPTNSLGRVGAHMQALDPALGMMPFSSSAASGSEPADIGLGLGITMPTATIEVSCSSNRGTAVDEVDEHLRPKTAPERTASACSLPYFSFIPNQPAAIDINKSPSPKLLPTRSPRQARRDTLPNSPYFPRRLSIGVSESRLEGCIASSSVGPTRSPPLPIGVGIGVGVGAGLGTSKASGPSKVRASAPPLSTATAPRRFTLETPPTSSGGLPITIASAEDDMDAGRYEGAFARLEELDDLGKEWEVL